MALLAAAIAAPRAATHAIPLRYDATLAAAGFPSPLLTATINGQRAVFIVDTGASVHTVARWFVEAAGLHAAASDGTVTGSTGAESRVEVVSNVSATLAGVGRVLLSEAVVTAFPPVFEANHIAGLVSPQLLAAPDEEAILDLARPRLTFRRSLQRRRLPAASTIDLGRACVNRESPFRNRLYAARVSVEGVDAELLLDTGATSTTLDAAAAAAQALRGRATDGDANQGVGGAIDRLMRVQDVRVTRGGASAVIDVRIGSVRNACGPAGLLGMDALRPCVLTLRPSDVAVTCARK